jgi:hypothetical protein
MHELYAPMIHFSNSFYKNQRENNEVYKNYNWCITIELCQIYFKTLILSNYLITKTYLYMNFIINYNAKYIFSPSKYIKFNF